MPEYTTEATIHMVRMYCPKCPGEMVDTRKYTETSGFSERLHRCDKCGHEQGYSKVYPYMEAE